MRQIFLDTETTGLSPHDGHKLVEIACLEMSKRTINLEKNGRWHFYINPEREVPQEAYNVHGLSNDFLQDKPKFHEIADGFLEFIAGAELIIHNAPFDLKFLNYELEQVGLPKITPKTNKITDTLAMARNLRPNKKNNLDALCDVYEIDRSKRTFHGALVDCHLLAGVYLAMTRGQSDIFVEKSSKSKNNDSTDTVFGIAQFQQISAEIAKNMVEFK